MLLRAFIDREISFMKNNLCSGLFFQFGDRSDVVKMSMRTDKVFYLELAFSDKVHNSVRFITGIGNKTFFRYFLDDEKTIVFERSDNKLFYYHIFSSIHVFLFSEFLSDHDGHGMQFFTFQEKDNSEIKPDTYNDRSTEVQNLLKGIPLILPERSMKENPC